MKKELHITDDMEFLFKLKPGGYTKPTGESSSSNLRLAKIG